MHILKRLAAAVALTSHGPVARPVPHANGETDPSVLGAAAPRGRSPVGPTKASLAKRFFGAGVTAIVLAGVVGGPVGAAPPISRGPAITNLVVDGNCRVSMTYSATGGKLGEVDMWAQTWGFTSLADPTPGYDIWAGFTWQPANMVRGSADVVFQLAPGGHLKKFSYYGWLYTRDIGTYKNGTASPILTFLSTCVMPQFEYTVKFHDNYTSGDAGFLPAYQHRVRFGQLITEPAPPTRSGYTFAGWRGYLYGYLPYGSIPWNFGVDTMSDYDPLVMFAQWTPA